MVDSITERDFVLNYIARRRWSNVNDEHVVWAKEIYKKICESTSNRE